MFVVVSLGYNQYWSSGFFEVLCPGASEGLRKPILVTHIRTVFRTYSRKVLIFLYLRVQGGEQDARYWSEPAAPGFALAVCM